MLQSFDFFDSKRSHDDSDESQPVSSKRCALSQSDEIEEHLGERNGQFELFLQRSTEVDKNFTEMELRTRHAAVLQKVEQVRSHAAYASSQCPKEFEPCPVTLPGHWDVCRRCDNKLPKAPHEGLPVYSPLGDCTAHCVKVNETSYEFKKIKSDLETEPGIKIYSVTRIQNSMLYAVYDFERRKMQHRYKGEKIERSDLYHTGSADMESIVFQGLDARLSSVGFFGRGWC